jgi:hypothetical protein
MKQVNYRCHTLGYIDSDATHKEYIEVWLKRLSYDENKTTTMFIIFNYTEVQGILSRSTIYMKNIIS